MPQWSQPMQSSADIALQPTDKKANFCQLTQLLICGGGTLLRETFDSIYPPAALPQTLGHPGTKSYLKQLRDHKKVLTQPEWNLLYPSAGLYGKSTDFDITLLFKLFRNICNLTQPCTGWDNLPISTDLSLEADLVRIKYYRNEVYAHSMTMELSDSKFKVLWGEISAALLRIAGILSSAKKDEWQESIDKFRCNPSTPDAQRYLAELQLWCKKDMDTKEEVEKLRSDFEKLSGKIQEQNINIQIIAESLQQGSGSAISPGHLPSSFAGQFNEASQPSEYISIAMPAEQPALSGDFQTKQPHSPADVNLWRVIMSFKTSFTLLMEYMTVKLGVHVVENRVGCLVITVWCGSLEVLNRLWDDYQTGHLNDVIQETLVTAEVLKELGLHELKLKTTIPPEEYKACKEFLTLQLDVAVVPSDEGRKPTLSEQHIIQAFKKPHKDRQGDVPSLHRHNPMIEKLLRKFSELNFSEDGLYYPVSQGRTQEIKPLVLMVKEERSCMKRPLKKYNYTTLARMEKFVVGAKEQEFLDSLNLHVRKDHPQVESQDQDDDEDDDEEMESATRAEGVKITVSDGQGYLDLGKVERDFIDDDKVCKILGDIELDRNKMKAFKDQQLRLITSVVYSERFEHKGKRATEFEAIPNPYSVLKGQSKKKSVPSKIATRNTRGPFLFKCRRVVYNEETNRLEIVGKSDRKRADEDEDAEEYESTILGSDDEESELEEFFTEDDRKKLEKIKKSVLLPAENREERKARVSKYQEWFEEALATKNRRISPDEGLTKEDRNFLQGIFVSAPPHQRVVDLSNFSEDKIQGYAIVLKFIADLSDAEWDEIEKAWAESGQHK